MGSMAMWGAIGGAGRSGEKYLLQKADQDWKSKEAEIDYKRQEALTRLKAKIESQHIGERTEGQKGIVETAAAADANTRIPAETESRKGLITHEAETARDITIPAETAAREQLATHQGEIDKELIEAEAIEDSALQWERLTWQEWQNALDREHDAKMQKWKNEAAARGTKASETFFKHQLDRFEKGDLTEEIIGRGDFPLGVKNMPGVYDRDTGTWYVQHGDKLMYAKDGDRKPGIAPPGGATFIEKAEDGTERTVTVKEGQPLPKPNAGHINGLYKDPNQIGAFYNRFGFIPRIYLSALRDQAMRQHFGTAGSE